LHPGLLAARGRRWPLDGAVAGDPEQGRGADSRRLKPKAQQRSTVNIPSFRYESCRL
jgi:hypothetical protein